MKKLLTLIIPIFLSCTPKQDSSDVTEEPKTYTYHTVILNKHIEYEQVRTNYIEAKRYFYMDNGDIIDNISLEEYIKFNIGDSITYERTYQ